MNKQYEPQESGQSMANEPTEAYPVRQEALHLDILLDSNAVISDIKKAIEMIKGIAGVRISTEGQTRLSGIDQGLNDIKNGNVFYAKDSKDLVNQIFG